MDKTYIRKLSSTERLWLGANAAFPFFGNRFILEGHGHIDYATLCHAVETASAANPGSRLVLKGFLSGCYWVDSGVTPPVRMIDGKNWDARSNHNAPFLNENLSYKGPTCEVVYLPGEVTRIVFRTHHAVMDGGGTFIWMEDIFRVLRGEKPIGSQSSLSDYELIASVTDKTARIERIPGIAPTGRAGRKAQGMSWKRITLSGRHSNLFGRIAVALAKSAWTYQDGRVRVGEAFDLRQRVECPRSMGNLSQGIIMEITKDSTPESVAKDLQDQIDQKNYLVNIERDYNLHLVPIWLIGLIGRMIAKMALKKGLFNIPISISNLGRVDDRNFNGGGFTADSFFVLPLNGDASPAFVTISGLSDKIEIIVCAPNMISDQGRLDKLVDDIRKVFTG